LARSVPARIVVEDVTMSRSLALGPFEIALAATIAATSVLGAAAPPAVPS
jgi:hypothetical protein